MPDLFGRSAPSLLASRFMSAPPVRSRYGTMMLEKKLILPMFSILKPFCSKIFTKSPVVPIWLEVLKTS